MVIIDWCWWSLLSGIKSRFFHDGRWRHTRTETFICDRLKLSMIETTYRQMRIKCTGIHDVRRWLILINWNVGRTGSIPMRKNARRCVVLTAIRTTFTGRLRSMWCRQFAGRCMPLTVNSTAGWQKFGAMRWHSRHQWLISLKVALSCRNDFFRISQFLHVSFILLMTFIILQSFIISVVHYFVLALLFQSPKHLFDCEGWRWNHFSDRLWTPFDLCKKMFLKNKNRIIFNRNFVIEILLTFLRLDCWCACLKWLVWTESNSDFDSFLVEWTENLENFMKFKLIDILSSIPISFTLLVGTVIHFDEAVVFVILLVFKMCS